MTLHQTIAAAEAMREDLSPFIRDITEEEIATFWRDGFVHVKGFVNKDLCEQVLQHFCDWSGLMREWPSDPEGQKEYIRRVDEFQGRGRGSHFAIRQADPWMFNYVTQRKFGEAAARFLKVPSVRMISETLHCKYPAGSGKSRPLDWHQDFPFLPLDRAEAVQFWCALVPITPEMGSMSHLIGSHRSMPGGMLSVNKEDPQEIYPEIFQQYKASEPKAHDAGDAVFHHCLTWHSSGVNNTGKPRWAMSNYRASTRSLYTGQANYNTDGLGLVPRTAFEHPNFPIVYP